MKLSYSEKATRHYTTNAAGNTAIKNETGSTRRQNTRRGKMSGETSISAPLAYAPRQMPGRLSDWLLSAALYSGSNLASSFCIMARHVNSSAKGSQNKPDQRARGSGNERRGNSSPRYPRLAQTTNNGEKSPPDKAIYSAKTRDKLPYHYSQIPVRHRPISLKLSSLSHWPNLHASSRSPLAAFFLPMLLVRRSPRLTKASANLGAIGNGLRRQSAIAFGKLFHGAADIAAIVIIYSIHGFGRNSQVYELQAFGYFLRPNRGDGKGRYKPERHFSPLATHSRNKDSHHQICPACKRARARSKRTAGARLVSGGNCLSTAKGPCRARLFPAKPRPCLATLPDLPDPSARPYQTHARQPCAIPCFKNTLCQDWNAKSDEAGAMATQPV